MTKKTTKALDSMGRLMIPAHIKRALNLNPHNEVSVEFDGKETITVRRAGKRCEMCGCNVEKAHHTTVRIGDGEKRICFDCAQKIAKAMIK